MILSREGTIMEYTLVNIKTIPAEGYGQLSFFEGSRDIPFDIKRIYYISGVPEGKMRGFHAHKQLQQLLFCPYGSIEIILDDGKQRQTVLLDGPEKGLLLQGGLWREMLWKKSDSVLCVAVSDYYTEEDYIRDYDAFLKYKAENA